LPHGAERPVRREIGDVESIRDSERTGKTFDGDSFGSRLEKALLACCGLEIRAAYPFPRKIEPESPCQSDFLPSKNPRINPPSINIGMTNIAQESG